MNPLQSLQAEQALSQIQLYSSDSVKKSSESDVSFAEVLRNAQEERSPEVKSDKVSQNDSQEPSMDKVQDRENSADEKKTLAQKKSSENSEKTEIAKSETETEEAVEQNAALQGFAVLENRIQQDSSSFDAASQEIAVNAEDLENTITEKNLFWLSKADKVNQNNADSVNADEFADLIDAAIEFIPGTETEAEKLSQAQNLSITDPESFLAQVNQLADKEIADNESILNQKFSFDKAENKSKKNDVKLAVHDLRSKNSVNAQDNLKTVQKAAARKEMNLAYQQKNDSTMQFTMDLANKAEANILSSNAQAAGANGSTFQSMLANTVQANAPEFVKAGNILLKDNNQGTINLILKPEALGNVKISLNLSDKVISGTINVQTPEAMEAFREAIDSLKQAFTESGFDTGSFDLNFSNEQQSFAQGGNEHQNQQAAFMAERSYGDFVSTGELKTGAAETAYSAGSNYNVNIVA